MMEPRPARQLPAALTETLAQAIPPQQVWPNLTMNQQHHLLQTIVLICQELLTSPLHAQGKGVAYD